MWAVKKWKQQQKYALHIKKKKKQILVRNL